jgi:OmpA-OmpF porin, OOP family
MKKSLLFITVSTLIISTNLYPQERREQDIEGGKDHPLISRFKGSVMEAYEHKNYNEYTLVLGFNENGEADEQINIEGEVTRIQYSASEEHSVFELFRNYEIALNDAGFTISFSCSEKTSTASWEFWYYDYYRDINIMNPDWIIPNGRMGFRYIVANGENNGNNVYIVLFISSDDDYPWILTTMDVIEEKPLETGLVTAASIDKGINLSGHTVLKGLFFDTGESTLRPESDAALTNIAEYLNTGKDRKVYIVGHTDNTGDFSSNMTLSEERAKAVMNKLSSGYSVDPGQMEACGVSSLSPLSSNSNEEGRARNRRVEIVEQ